MTVICKKRFTNKVSINNARGKQTWQNTMLILYQGEWKSSTSYPNGIWIENSPVCCSPWRLSSCWRRQGQLLEVSGTLCFWFAASSSFSAVWKPADTVTSVSPEWSVSSRQSFWKWRSLCQTRTMVLFGMKFHWKSQRFLKAARTGVSEWVGRPRHEGMGNANKKTDKVIDD